MLRWVTLLAVLAALALPASASARDVYPFGGRCTYQRWVCKALEQGAASPHLGGALNVMARDAAYKFGVRDDGLAGCWGLLWPAELAWKFYNVLYFSPASRTVLAASRAEHDRLPASFHTACP